MQAIRNFQYCPYRTNLHGPFAELGHWRKGESKPTKFGAGRESRGRFSISEKPKAMYSCETWQAMDIYHFSISKWTFTSTSLLQPGFKSNSFQAFSMSISRIELEALLMDTV